MLNNELGGLSFAFTEVPDMIRTAFSLALVALSLFAVAPSASAVTDAQFTAFSNRVYASNKAMLARIATLEKEKVILQNDIANLKAESLNARIDIEVVFDSLGEIWPKLNSLIGHISIDDRDTLDMSDDTIRFVGERVDIPRLIVTYFSAYSASFGYASVGNTLVVAGRALFGDIDGVDVPVEINSTGVHLNIDGTQAAVTAFGLDTTGSVRAKSVYGQDYLLEAPGGGVLNFTVAFTYLRNTLFQHFGVPIEDTSLDSFGDWVSAAQGK